MEDNKAKMSILKELRKMAMDDMGEGLKKVTVAAPTEGGLKKGLDTAEDMVGEMHSDEGEHKEYQDEVEAKLQDLVDMCSSPEDLDKKIAFLEKAKQEKFGSEQPSEEPEEMPEEEY